LVKGLFICIRLLWNPSISAKRARSMSCAYGLTVTVSPPLGSVETLFWWGGNCLYDFASNLFSKRHIKFHQNRPHFPGHSVHR